MMLDISFYSEKECLDTMQVTDDFYQWLGQSMFPKIGRFEKKMMQADEESVDISVIRLEGENRRKFSDFFRDAIVQESDQVMEKLGDSPSKDEYTETTSRLKKLQELRKMIEDEKFKYFSYAD